MHEDNIEFKEFGAILNSKGRLWMRSTSSNPIYLFKGSDNSKTYSDVNGVCFTFIYVQVVNKVGLYLFRCVAFKSSHTVGKLNVSMKFSCKLVMSMDLPYLNQ